VVVWKQAGMVRRQANAVLSRVQHLAGFSAWLQNHHFLTNFFLLIVLFFKFFDFSFFS